MRHAIILEAERTGYSIDQVADCAISVRTLRSLLDDFEDEDLVIISHDSGYTYGSLPMFDYQFGIEEPDGSWSVE